MRKELLKLSSLFPKDKVWLMFMAIFATAERVNGLLYEAEQKLERR